MSTEKRSFGVDNEGDQRETEKEAVMITLREEMDIPQEDIDFLYAHFGEQCLVSIEKFFEYKEINEKEMRRNQPRQSDIGAHSLCQESEEAKAFEYQLGSETDDKGAEWQLPATETETETELMIENENTGKWLSVDGCAEIKSHIDKFGLKGIKDVLLRNLDEWKGKPLNIAVTGHSGNGKSSLINAMRKMNEWDKGAAKVDEKECTTICTPYSHPEYDNIVFWDVPGVGTKTFPKETYIETIKLYRYDFFLIILSKRFDAIDVWLANEIRKRNKHFYFIRTHTDVDMKNIQRRPNKNYDEQKEFDELKQGQREKITKDLESSDFHFFMISNHNPEKYDFPHLLQQLLEDAQNEKKLAMVFGIAGMSKTLIEQKASALESRIWMCALASGVAAAIPIPFLSTAIDYGVILEEVIFYRAQLALDDDSLEHLAQMANVSLNQLKQEVKFKAPEDIFTVGGLARYMAKHATGKVVEKVAKYTLPVIGSVLSCGYSISTTIGVLVGILEMMKQDAIMVLVYVSAKHTTV